MINDEETKQVPQSRLTDMLGTDMASEMMLVSGMKSLGIPPLRLVVKVGRGLQERILIATLLQQHTGSQQNLKVSNQMAPSELFAMAFALVLKGSQATLEQAKFFLGVQLHRMWQFRRSRKTGP